MQKRNGFTAVEIGLVVAVICVIAAMIIPTMLKNNNASKSKTVFKQSLANIKHAITMNVALDEFDFRALEDSSAGSDKEKPKTLKYIIEKRIDGAEDITDDYFDSKNSDENILYISYDYVCKEDDVIAYSEGKKGAYECKKKGDIVKSSPVEYKFDKDNFIVYTLDDGAVFGFYKKAAKCTGINDKYCVGFIDTNGIVGPNKLVTCDNEQYNYGESCIVSEEKITDIFPVIFYNQSIEPASTAARSLLSGYKSNQK